MPATNYTAVSDDLVQRRKALFELGEEMELSEDELRIYWPFFDTIYSTTGRSQSPKRLETKKQYFHCRLHPTKPRQEKYVSKNVEVRMKPSRTPIACPKTMVRLTYPNGRVVFKPSADW